MRKEIKIKELMIGNYLQCNSEIIEVAEIRKNSVKSTKGKIYKIEDLEPIKTTDEWLFRLGFDYKNGNEYVFQYRYGWLEVRDVDENQDDYRLFEDNTIHEDDWDGDEDWCDACCVNEVHTLQNAFMIIGIKEEITIIKPHIKLKASIKFNSVKEYRDIESKLTSLGFENEKEYNESEIKDYIKYYTEDHTDYYVHIYGTFEAGSKSVDFSIWSFPDKDIKRQYNSLEEFLNDEAWKR